jgi:hypothetical protein
MAKKVYILKEKEYAQMVAFKSDLESMLRIEHGEYLDILDAIGDLKNRLSVAIATAEDLSKPKTEQDAKFHFLIKLINPVIGLSVETTDPLAIVNRIKYLLVKDLTNGNPQP